MLTSFEAISLYAVLSGSVGLSIGSRVFPSAKTLDRAWRDGYKLGGRDSADAAYWRGRDDEYEEWERSNGEPAEKAPQDPQPRAEEDDERREEQADRSSLPPEAAERLRPAPGSADWADELGGIRTQIAVDDATEVLAAAPDPPSPGSFEYYASERQQEFDHWLAGIQAEFGARKRELTERSAA